jgi:hypothetical protein
MVFKTLQSTKLIYITILIDIYHLLTLYVSTINIANSIISVNIITEVLTKLQDEILIN